MNSSIKSGQDLNICISTESEPAEKENLHWGETCLTCEWANASGLCRTHSCLHSFGQSLGLSLRSCWKTNSGPFFSHFFPPCRLLGSQALLQSGVGLAAEGEWPVDLTLFFLPTSLCCVSSNTHSTESQKDLWQFRSWIGEAEDVTPDQTPLWADYFSRLDVITYCVDVKMIPCWHIIRKQLWTNRNESPPPLECVLLSVTSQWLLAVCSSIWWRSHVFFSELTLNFHLSFVILQPAWKLRHQVCNQDASIIV